MADPLFGKTWKMVPAASIFSAGFTPSQETRLYEDRPNGYKLTVSGVHNGANYSWSYEAYHDGKSYPVTGRSDVDAITIYKLSDKFTCGFFTVGPNQSPGGPYARKVSASGDSLTVESAGRRTDGTPFYDVITYEL
jgi:hypothetical protein